jgi:hypothetical protein
VEAGFHREAIRMVARGQADGSAIDSQVHSIELREHPDLVVQVRVVEALGPWVPKTRTDPLGRLFRGCAWAGASSV